MANNEEKKDITGLSVATDKKAAEYDLVTSLLEAADFRNEDEKEVELRRNGKLLFTIHLRALSDSESRMCRKNATTYMKNPAGKGYPPIEKEHNSSLYNSWLIYTATRDDDKEKIWGNKAVMDKYGLLRPVESIDVLLKIGEKMKLLDIVTEISGMGDEEGDITPEDYAKN